MNPRGSSFEKAQAVLNFRLQPDSLLAPIHEQILAPDQIMVPLECLVGTAFLPIFLKAQASATARNRGRTD
jgi:hypothetical protein